LIDILCCCPATYLKIEIINQLHFQHNISIILLCAKIISRIFQGEQGFIGGPGAKGERGSDGLPGRDAIAVEGETVPGPEGPPVIEY